MATHSLDVDDLPRTHKSGVKKWALLALLVLGAIVIAAGALLAVKWPFTRKRVIARLQQTTATAVQIGSFHEEYFPHPGCLARQVTFQQSGGHQPLMTIQTLAIRGSFFGLFSKHVALIRADGTHIVLPALRAGLSLGGHNQSGTIVDQLIADGTVLDSQPKNKGGRPAHFLLRQFRLRGLGGNSALSFQMVIENPEPPGEITASGSFGPWKTGSAPSTSVSGRYSFRHARLSSFRGIAGTLSSDGVFRGSFRDLQVEGAAEVPDFEAANSGHKFHLRGQFHALVNVTDGDVTLEQAVARLGHTTVVARGRIAPAQTGQGKTAGLDLTVQNGRIEDVLLLFVKDKRAPLMGITSFRARITLPPGQGGFLRKAQLAGQFGIGGAHFTNLRTETSLTNLSRRARGRKDQGKLAEDPARVLSDLRGQVLLKNGLATFSNLQFVVPGARAQMHGTYDLINQRINLRGLLYMEAKLSHATSGVKSFLLKALGPFLKSNHRGEVLPVTITGTYDHPSYHLSPQSKK